MDNDATNKPPEPWPYQLTHTPLAQGWQCPVDGRVFAPHVMECPGPHPGCLAVKRPDVYRAPTTRSGQPSGE
jgi:hypothetical protein